jgi:acyl carrier protein
VIAMRGTTPVLAAGAATNYEEPVARRETEAFRSAPEVHTPDLAVNSRRPVLSASYTAPRSQAEESLVKIWQHLLGANPVGVNDDFFELRGDSLLAAQVVSRVNKAFQTKLPLSTLFDAPTIASLAERIEQVRSSVGEPKPSELLHSEEEEGVIE